MKNAPMKQIFTEFLKSREGAFNIIFALSLIVLVGAIGGALDYSNALRERTKIQNAADAAVLAGAAAFNAGKTAAQARQAAQSMFAAQYTGGIEPTFNVNTDENSVDISINETVPTYLLAAVGFDGFEVQVKATATGSPAATTGGTSNKVLVDIAMCLDATASMTDTLFAAVNSARNFDADLIEALEKKGKKVDKIKVRPIFYRDFDDILSRGAGSLVAKRRLIRLPENRSALEAFLGKESAEAGGNLPEAGLECFYTALHTKWSNIKNNQIVYPVIAVWTDAPADELSTDPNSSQQDNITESGGSYGSYPVGMPRKWADLEGMWNNSQTIDQNNKIFVLFGPKDETGWKTLMKWNGMEWGGPLGAANADFVGKLADKIATKIAGGDKKSKRNVVLTR